MNQKGALASCAVCSKETTRRCSRCLDVYYCSRDHQRDDWKKHKSECLPKLTEEEPHKNNTKKKTSKKVLVNLQHQLANASSEKEGGSVTFQKEETPGTLCNIKPDECEISAVISKQNYETVTDSGDCSTSAEQSVNKIAELSILQNNIIKLNVVYSEDISSESAITYEGSSEKEILSESAQQLNNVALPTDSTSSVLKSVSNQEAKMPAMPALSTRHKEYPEASLKGVFPNYNLDSGDPAYEICQRVIRDMSQYGVCVLDNFLGRDRGLLVLKEVLEMYRSGIFTAGQLVSNPASTEAKTIRSDRITWIDGKEPHCYYIGTLINQVDSIILRANKMQTNGKLGDYVINGRTKAMVACYPGSGSHYVKHVDNPNKDGRCITAIYYLNLDWDVNRNGGLLRVFPEGTDTVANIEPIFDRMLFFWSDRRNPHEVQPAFATRYAITLWYFDSQEREEALRLYKSRAIKPTSSK